MRRRDAPMINTRPPWTQPWPYMVPVRASSNISFVHMHDSHGMTLPGGPLGRPPQLLLPQV
jgi:hypothetical protein